MNSAINTSTGANRGICSMKYAVIAESLTPDFTAAGDRLSHHVLKSISYFFLRIILKEKFIQRTKQESSIQRFEVTHWRSESEFLLTLRDPRMFVSEIDHTAISAWSKPAAPAEPVLSLCTTLGSQGAQNPCVRWGSRGQGRCKRMAQVLWWTPRWQIMET